MFARVAGARSPSKVVLPASIFNKREGDFGPPSHHTQRSLTPNLNKDLTKSPNTRTHAFLIKSPSRSTLKSPCHAKSTHQQHTGAFRGKGHPCNILIREDRVEDWEPREDIERVMDPKKRRTLEALLQDLESEEMRIVEREEGIEVECQRLSLQLG